MKKIILTLAIAISSIASFAAGEETVVNATIQNAFNKEFAGATDVAWTIGKSSYKASFVMNNQRLMAYYTTDGELMGITRNLSSLDLPLNLQTGLKKSYNDYWISDLFEVSNNDGSSYYITLEKADESVVLESSNGSKWTVYKKITKA